MIPDNITITLSDDKLNKLMSLRGAFPVNWLLHNPDDLFDWNDGLHPNPSEDVYFIKDVLRVLMNMKRYNFIELMFGVPKEDLFDSDQIYLF